MKWEEIDISSDLEIDPFVSIGKGSIKISKGASKLIDSFDECN